MYNVSVARLAGQLLVLGMLACRTFAAQAATGPPDVAIDKIPQEASLLCWAAASQIAINRLRKLSGSPVIQQWEVALLAWWDGDAKTLPYWQGRCMADIENCNKAYYPQFDYFGYTFKNTAPLESLDFATIESKLTDRQPVVFEWGYYDPTQNSNGSYEFRGSHVLVIFGAYTTATNQNKLKIWDPLPVQSHGTSATPFPDSLVGGGSERSIKWETYSAADAGTRLDMGWSVAHMGDYYDIAAKAAPPPDTGHTVPAAPGNLTVSSGGPAPVALRRLSVAQLQGVSLRRANRESREFARTELSAVAESEMIGVSATTTAKEGDPLPIVAVGLSELSDAQRSPSDILHKKVTTVLYPVLSGHVVTDSYLMIRQDDRWVEGGYANTKVTARLEFIRDTLADHGWRRRSYYVLSVPALSAHFLARGKGDGATLYPASDDPSLGVAAGVAYKASDLFPRLAAVARNVRSAGHRTPTIPLEVR
jgi:hypothetical protein